MTIGKLGLRPGDPTRPAVRLSAALAAAIPAHPAAVDYAAKVAAWGMLGNDRYGDCGPAGVAHGREQITTYLTATPYTPTDADTLAFYKACNPGFDPATGAGDDGVVLQDMLGVAARHGFAGAKPVCYARVDHTNLDEVRAAIAIFGNVLFGVDLQTAQQTQTDAGGPWDYRPSDTWGGHCALAVDYNDGAAGAVDIGVVTWGHVIGTTDAFLQHQLTEAWAIIWPEHLGTVPFLAGVDTAILAADYTAVTGRPFPAVTPPAPTPPGDPTAAFVAVMDPWAAMHHTGLNAVAARAYRAWRHATGH